MPPKLIMRPWQLALLAAVFIVAADDTAIFSMLFQRLDLQSAAGLGFLVLASTLMVVTIGGILLMTLPARLFKWGVGVMLLLSAVCGYFVNRLGVVIGTDMLINVVETVRDRNSAEAFELLSFDLAVYLLLHGLVPVALLAFIRLERRPWLQELKERTVFMATSLMIVVALFAADFRYSMLFPPENRDLRRYAVPLYPLSEAAELIGDAFATPAEFRTFESRPGPAAAQRRRRIGVMVVGETARADHFSLNGYHRPTNPRLSARDDLFFADAAACGTSTAYSVPCMFFLRGQGNYSPAAAKSESNVLDLLQSAGVTPVWIDNNSSCKNVCTRIRSSNLREQPDGTLQLDGDYDAVLIPAMEAVLREVDGDILVVLHMMGSHGPAYSRRYPAEFEVFGPSCKHASPVECETDEVVNAYDNSIVYSDHIVDRLIASLEAQPEDVDAFLMYASDHGESLGEDGVYLHGLPTAIAPLAQTRVPLMLWLSNGHWPNGDAAKAPHAIGARDDLSHDYIAHTLLGLFNVKSSCYRSDRDLRT